MEVIDLKFLLKLLEKPNYQAPISHLKPNSKTKASERNRICRKLWQQEIVTCTEEVTKIKITAAGKALLKLNAQDLPISPQEVKILKACENQTIQATTKDTKVSPASLVKELSNKLLERGFIQAAQKELKEVSLTERGKEFLLYDYNPNGNGNTSLTQNQLGVFLTFFRKNSAPQPTATKSKVSESSPTSTEQPTDEEILQTIITLNKELGTNNYLPIFHLRRELQPPLSREELDQSLYRLEEKDKIEMSTLAEGNAYTTEQVQAGIPQLVGGPLFFIIVS